jgi:hypothetical protein
MPRKFKWRRGVVVFSSLLENYLLVGRDSMVGLRDAVSHCSLLTSSRAKAPSRAPNRDWAPYRDRGGCGGPRFLLRSTLAHD